MPNGALRIFPAKVENAEYGMNVDVVIIPCLFYAKYKNTKRETTKFKRRRRPIKITGAFVLLSFSFCGAIRGVSVVPTNSRTAPSGDTESHNEIQLPLSLVRWRNTKNEFQAET